MKAQSVIVKTTLIKPVNSNQYIKVLLNKYYFSILTQNSKTKCRNNC